MITLTLSTSKHLKNYFYFWSSTKLSHPECHNSILKLCHLRHVTADYPAKCFNLRLFKFHALHFALGQCHAFFAYRI